MFSKKGFKESLSNEIEIEEIQYEGMIKLFEYFHTGTFSDIPINQCVSLYYVTSLYDIPNLLGNLRTLIRENLTNEIIFDISYFADIVQDNTMMLFCGVYIENHFDVLKMNEKYKDLSLTIQKIVEDRIKKMNRKSK